MMTNALLGLGTVAAVLGMFGGRLSPTLANRRGLMIAVGLAMIGLSAALGWPDLMQGYQDARNG